MSSVCTRLVGRAGDGAPASWGTVRIVVLDDIYMLCYVGIVLCELKQSLMVCSYAISLLHNILYDV